MTVLDIVAWRRTVSAVLRILFLLVVVGIIVPRLTLVLADFLTLPGKEGSPELRFQENVRKVLGFHRVTRMDVMKPVEQWFRTLSIELRRYYYLDITP